MTAGPGRKETFWSVTFFSLAGPLLWAVHLGAIYLVQLVVCALQPTGSDPRGLQIFVAAITAAVLLVLAVFGLRPAWLWKLLGARAAAAGSGRFLQGTMQVLMLLSFFGVLWAGASLLFLPSCPPLR